MNLSSKYIVREFSKVLSGTMFRYNREWHFKIDPVLAYCGADKTRKQFNPTVKVGILHEDA